MPAKVRVQNLRKAYGKVQALAGISFEIREGELFGLLGPNGAGKTTTVECLLGLREPDEGQIEIFGLDARQNAAQVKEKIGAALQTTSLQDKITPREALRLFGAFYRQPADPAALLQRFGIAEKADAPFDTLSGGQKQRLALALAFVNNPDLIILDEPAAGLDAQARRELHTAILTLKNEGCTILLTTHDIAEAEQLCDRIAIVDHGTIVASGTPAELVGQSKSALTVHLITNPPLDPDALAHFPGLSELASDGEALHFVSSNLNRTLTELASLLDTRHCAIVDLRIQRGTLEDVLIEMTGTRP
ncbi:MAG: hypothetical protein JWN34_3877 [Bryobacterales bacterium]|nr:hypothetical protein [Bryobacterales bacterium]